MPSDEKKLKSPPRENNEKKERFKEDFPALYQEIMEKKGTTLKLPVEDPSVQLKRTPEVEFKGRTKRRKLKHDPLKDFSPKVEDFIRRAKSIEEAIEIIEFLESQGEIPNQYTKELIRQLHEKGLESFGKRKINGYYYTYAEEQISKRIIEKSKKKETKWDKSLE